MKQKYDVAAYIWPAYTGREPRTRLFWPSGCGEWETVRKATAKFEGHPWPRKPLWGYVDEADPAVMKAQIETAVRYGVNVFIYDWYWFDHRPFLEQCLDEGFLGADNSSKMKFYIMWANHDANYTWDIRNSNAPDTVIWGGQIATDEFKTIGQRWIKQYFGRENYYRIDGKPVVAIYDLQNFIEGMGGIESAREGMEWLDSAARQQGLAGVHFQFVKWGDVNLNLSGVDAHRFPVKDDVIGYLPFSSLTQYQFVHFTDINRDYGDVIDDVVAEYDNNSRRYSIPYFAHVSVGWDNNPRFKEIHPQILRNNTPENFRKMLLCAKKFCDDSGRRLITVNSWNEWTEGSYLEPDDRNGYAYLESIKDVFTGD